MKATARILIPALAMALPASPLDAALYTVSTYDIGGADAEVRESNPTQNRGDSTEIASRVAPDAAGTRNSHVYLKWGIQNVPSGLLDFDITIRNFLRHENLSQDRIRDMDGLPPDEGNTGFDYYLLNAGNVGANWSELGITYASAPGLDYDGDTDTKDIRVKDFAFLGTHFFRDLVDENHLPVGEAIDLTLPAGSPLHQAITYAQDWTDHQSITVLVTLHHPASTTVAKWRNMNYILNPKEQTTLRDDLGYDMNESAGDGPEGSPWGGADNSMGQFSPQLLFVPEPGTLVLLGLGGLFLTRRRW